MKNLIKIIGAITFLSFYNIEAQEVVKKDTINGTELSITMDDKVNTIIKEMEDKCNTMVATKTNPDNTKGTSVKVDIPKKNQSNADICREHPKVSGFRIQVAVVKSSDEANEVKVYFRQKFPALKAITDASLRPNYKILAGSYFSKQSANADFLRVKQYFKEARVVEYYVFCVEAK